MKKPIKDYKTESRKKIKEELYYACESGNHWGPGPDIPGGPLPHPVPGPPSTPGSGGWGC